ncbi:MAG: NIL domain-containing protein [Candidatus Omnitrophota bacterium]
MEIALGLTFPNTLKDESVICHICKKYDIEVVIIEASFSMSSGWAILKVRAEEKEVEKVLQYLTNKDIKIERIQTGN